MSDGNQYGQGVSKVARSLARRGTTAAEVRQRAGDEQFWLEVAGEMDALEARSRFRVVTGDTAPFPADQFEYLVVADRLAERIRGGEFTSGRFPTRAEVMAHYGVGSGTVRHAWDELKQRGLIHVVQGHGTFIA